MTEPAAPAVERANPILFAALVEALQLADQGRHAEWTVAFLNAKLGQLHGLGPHDVIERDGTITRNQTPPGRLAGAADAAPSEVLAPEK